MRDDARTRDQHKPGRAPETGVPAARPPESEGIASTQGGFSTLSTLPSNVPFSYRRRWERLAARAATSYRAAVELKCLECCAWERTEAKRCALNGCPLWALCRRIFGARAKP